MPRRAHTYRLVLPSGGVVHVRRLTREALLAKGLLLFPLLAIAVEVGTGEESPPSDARAHLLAVCRVVLVDAEIDPAWLPVGDVVALYHWALDRDNHDAVLDAPMPWTAADLEPLVRGQTAVLLDVVCQRYRLRPSACLGIADPDLAFDLDAAVAYRGLGHERGSDTVEVEDMWGGKHRVPAEYQQPSHAANADGVKPRIIHADDLARRAIRMGLKEMSFSAGGSGDFGVMGALH